ncbi:GtrA family protein [Solimonas sp. K1W22B-7]|uniref:GtrA family protein n=1 Tax=Solimonas sp. K1W22B-7 TaxID=2303331 RepID=UPI000E3333AC|nr:GtrA family protein [Solimonas sp. K1W22B-7]AXQ30621.1 GtrA family protein [Solimonas sp. K1W22B-7]
MAAPQGTAAINPRQTARYLVSGAIAAGAYMAVTVWCRQAAGLSLLVSGIAGYVCAMPCAYLLHRYYSFRSRQPPAREAGKFIATSVIGAMLSGLIPQWLSAGGTPLAAALTVTSIVVPIINYLVLALWVFKRP